VSNFNVSIRLRGPTAQPHRIDAESEKRRKLLLRIVARRPTEERTLVIMESTRFALQDIALTKDFLVNRSLGERAHFEPAVQDWGTG